MKTAGAGDCFSPKESFLLEASLFISSLLGSGDVSHKALASGFCEAHFVTQYVQRKVRAVASVSCCQTLAHVEQL